MNINIYCLHCKESLKKTYSTAEGERQFMLLAKQYHKHGYEGVEVIDGEYFEGKLDRKIVERLKRTERRWTLRQFGRIVEQERKVG